MSVNAPLAPAEQLRREFDAAFAARPSDVADGLEAFVALRIGGDPYLARMVEIVGFAAARKIARLPGSPPALLGLAGVRGAVVPVYGLDVLLGYPPAHDVPRWFVLCGGADVAALAITDFEGHVRLPRARLPASAQHPSGRRHVGELVRVGDETRAVIDVASVVTAIEDMVASSRTTKER
jgi:chemotaxis signal transduction protein